MINVANYFRISQPKIHCMRGTLMLRHWLDLIQFRWVPIYHAIHMGK